VDDRERGCWAAFNRVPGIGPVRVRRLLAGFGSLSAAWDAPGAELVRAGLDRRSVAALRALRERVGPEGELERARRAGARVLTWQDGDYPARLTTIPDPPPVLYVRGTLLPQDERALAMVGTRRPTLYGRDVAERLAQALAAAGLTVVSGLAKGIDTHAHRGALAGGGRTLAVLGNGPDVVYPPENRRLAAAIAESGALLTDYPPGTGPEAQNFPPRNRIISGLAPAVLVVEAGERSGALITCRYALDQGRDVFAVPGPVTSPVSRGCHELIQDGARLVASAEDVLTALDGPSAVAGAAARAERAAQQLALDLASPAGAEAGPAARTRPDDDPATASLLEALAGAGSAAHVDQLARALGRPVQDVAGALTRLELAGRVRHVGGMRYILTAF
jgi:DNA processing protein